MTIPTGFDTYDWKEAFRYASQPEAAKPGSSVDLAAVRLEDVDAVIASCEGENDGDPWIIAGMLADGRWFFLTAWCDYTGWDCQSGGRCWVANTKRDLLKYGISESDRKRLGV